MCARYTIAIPPGLLKAFFALEEEIDLPPRFNLAPYQPLPIIRAGATGRTLSLAQWGLVPAWSKDPQSGPRPFNARAESLNEKPSFKNLLRQKRCLVPASGFFEWRKQTKRPVYFQRKDGSPLAFAGLWDRWGDRESFTIVTTEPNELVAPIHDRMPCILRPEDFQRWLDPACSDPAQLQGLLCPLPAQLMAAHDVSSRVNQVRNDGPELVLPLSGPENEQLSLFCFSTF